MAVPLIKDMEKMTDEYQERISMKYFQLTRKGYVLVFTGLENNRTFKALFHYLQKKVRTYWDGSKTTLNPRKGSGSIELTKALLSSP